MQRCWGVRLCLPNTWPIPCRVPKACRLSPLHTPTRRLFHCICVFPAIPPWCAIRYFPMFLLTMPSFIGLLYEGQSTVLAFSRGRFQAKGAVRVKFSVFECTKHRSTYCLALMCCSKLHFWRVSCKHSGHGHFNLGLQHFCQSRI